MQEPELMKVPFKYSPDIIEDRYNLKNLDNNGYIFVKIKKIVYGLKQAAVLVYDNLINKLAPYGYHPIPNTDSYWQHK